MNMRPGVRFVFPAWLGRRLGLLAMALGIFAAAPLPAQPGAVKEYHIKALFLFNFIQFVEWPDDAFSSADAPLVIGVLGDDPFGEVLDEVVRGETIKNRPISVKRSHRLSDLAGCQLIFISRSESRRLEETLRELENRPVLTVGETDRFAHRGGIIAFYPDGKKVRFEINPSTARRVGLKISSELLGLGKIAAPDSGENGNR